MITCTLLILAIHCSSFKTYTSVISMDFKWFKAIQWLQTNCQQFYIWKWSSTSKRKILQRRNIATQVSEDVKKRQETSCWHLMQCTSTGTSNMYFTLICDLTTIWRIPLLTKWILLVVASKWCSDVALDISNSFDSSLWQPYLKGNCGDFKHFFLFAFFSSPMYINVCGKRLQLLIKYPLSSAHPNSAFV